MPPFFPLIFPPKGGTKGGTDLPHPVPFTSLSPGVGPGFVSILINTSYALLLK